MRTALRARVLVLGLLLFGFSAALACGGSRGGKGGDSGGDSWAVAERIPADTPYVFAALTSIPDSLVQKFAATLETQLAQAHAQLMPLLAASSSPWAKVASTLLDELRAQKPTKWWQTVGFAPGGRFVLYGLSLWPVMRLEVANVATVQQNVQRYLDLAQAPAQPTRQGEWTTWQLPFEGSTVIIAVSAREAVLSAMPANLVPAAMPWLLGTKKPARTLAQAGTLPGLMSQHGFLPYFLGVFDLQQTLAILTGRSTGPTQELSAALNLAQLAGCASDLDRLSALTPRMTFGYTRLDEQEFSGGLVVEMPANVATALNRLVTTNPGITWPPPNNPLFAMAAAVDVRNTLALIGEVGKELQQKPFTCGALEELNDLGESWRGLASSPLPPVVTGLRGLSVVVTNATIEPLDIIGHVLAVGEQLETLPGMLALVPGLGGISLPADGTATALPIAQLGLPWAKSAHAALRADRLAVAVGGDSSRVVGEQLKANPSPRAPLFAMSFEADKVAKLSPLAAQAFSGYQYFRSVAFSLEMKGQGLHLTMDGTW
jgi:hypothetical protein